MCQGNPLNESSFTGAVRFLAWVVTILANDGNSGTISEYKIQFSERHKILKAKRFRFEHNYATL
jgi:hypothetical protein